MSKNLKALSAQSRRTSPACDRCGAGPADDEPPIEVPAELADFYARDEWFDARSRLIATRRARRANAEARKSNYFETIFSILWREFMDTRAQEAADVPLENSAPEPGLEQQSRSAP